MSSLEEVRLLKELTRIFFLQVWDENQVFSYCPADGRILNSERNPPIRPKTEAGIDRAVQKAQEAQVEWAKTTFGQRRQVLRTLLQHVLDHQDEIVRACCLDSGKTKVDAFFGEILVSVEKLKWTIDHGEKALRPSKRPTNLLMMYKKNTVFFEPLGVIAALVSWNYPFHNFLGPIISALFTGNAILVKPSEQTAWSTVYFGRIIQGALIACGHSPELIQTVVCLPKAAARLTSHPDIAHITFIGSRPVAYEVCKSAAKALIPVCVELGGKDPAVILDDPKTIKDLPELAKILMRGVFQSAGQNCVGLERIIALPNVYDKIISIVEPKIRALRVGSVLLDSTTKPALMPDLGAMISPASFTRLEKLIASAVRDGARLLVGGTRYEHRIHKNGHYFTPTLLVDVTPSMEIAQTETFAPIFLLMRAETVSDAISIANSTPYALGSSVFGYHTPSVEQCIRGIKAGMVAVNDMGAFYAVQMPFGGLKGSGYGRFAGEEGLRGLCNLKAVCRDSALGQTRIPPVVDYPIDKRWGAGKEVERARQNAWEFCKGIAETGYGIGIVARVKGVVRLLGNMA